MKLIFVFVQIIGISFICASNDVPCETILELGTVKLCYMTKTTEILSEEVSVSSPADSSVRSISFHNNKKIIFLPLRVDLKFPNLDIYAGSNCAIEKISKKNFMNLKHLVHLFLYNNQIEYVPSDTFEDLIAIERIGLKGNKIKALNGDVFKGLPKLIYVNLENNKCINEEFRASNISNLVKNVDKKCKFFESSTKVDEKVDGNFTEVFESSAPVNERVAILVNQLTAKAEGSSQHVSKIATLFLTLLSLIRLIT